MPRHPALYQVNTRVWVNERARTLGRAATLDDIADESLDRLAARGFSWVWLLSVWRTGAAGRRVSREQPEWRREFQAALPDLREDDIQGSGFAVADYAVSPALGGEAALERLRERLRTRGIRMMLDFVPNHTALDHRWVAEHPEYYVAGGPEQLAREPQNYARLPAGGGVRILAHGRDPNFPGWPDTLQLDYSRPATHEAMQQELVRIAGLCDGLRCDMAMLLLPDVFERTWGRRAGPFWPAAIRQVRERWPEFAFLAEVYWDLEGTLLQQGFDYAYDKTLYDRLREGSARSIRDHLGAGLDDQSRLARFLENHDEPRAAAVFPPGVHEIAAVITYLSPGLRFFHQGQLEGRRIRIPTHLVRAPIEPVDERIREFYGRLLEALRRPALHQGRWRLLECRPAWEGNGTWDGFIVAAWDAAEAGRCIVAVNGGPGQGQCYAPIPFKDLRGRAVRLRDLLGPAVYDRSGDELLDRGLYLDMPARGHHVFEVLRAA